MNAIQNCEKYMEMSQTKQIVGESGLKNIIDLPTQWLSCYSVLSAPIDSNPSHNATK